MMKPINGHLLIDPVKRESFVSSQRETFQEIGIVLGVSHDHPISDSLPQKGDKVMFDAWLGKKFPKEGSDSEYYWLIKFSDIVAYETAK